VMKAKANPASVTMKRMVSVGRYVRSIGWPEVYG
jgi:hypothetical protein